MVGPLAAQRQACKLQLGWPGGLALWRVALGAWRVALLQPTAAPSQLPINHLSASSSSVGGSGLTRKLKRLPWSGYAYCSCCTSAGAGACGGARAVGARAVGGRGTRGERGSGAQAGGGAGCPGTSAPCLLGGRFTSASCELACRQPGGRGQRVRWVQCERTPRAGRRPCGEAEKGAPGGWAPLPHAPCAGRRCWWRRSSCRTCRWG